LNDVKFQIKNRMGVNYGQAYCVRFCGYGCGGSDCRSFGLWSTGSGDASRKVCLRDIVAKRATSWAASHDQQTGRSVNTRVAPDSSTIEDEKDQITRSERDARNARLDDINEMRREADAYTVQAAELRQIADAAQPLYDTLDDRQRHRLVQFVREDLRANIMDDQRDRRQ
jgi:hypothetical protein